MRMTEHGFGRKGLRQNFRTCEPGFKQAIYTYVTPKTNQLNNNFTYAHTFLIPNSKL